MTDVYCDQSLGSGDNNGTTWVHAYRLLSDALDGSNTGADDTLWVKNDASIGSSPVLISGLTTINKNPPNVIGCISTASTTPPPASEVVPGLRNGSSTRAYDQTSGNAAPTLTVTVAAGDIRIEGHFGLVYALKIIADDDIDLFNDLSEGRWEECEFKAGDQASTSGDIKIGGSTSLDSMKVSFKNCKLHSLASAGFIIEGGKLGEWNFDGCEIDFTATAGQLRGGDSVMNFNGCDFTGSTSPIIGHHSSMTSQGKITLKNCKIHTSSALVTGSVVNDTFTYEFSGTSSVTGKTTGGSFQEVELLTRQGNIVHEVTAVRTGGADDGATGGWSLAFTPVINETRDNVVALVGPPMMVEIVGDGTAQTVTVFIANDLAEDAGNTYDNDEVWMEVTFPSATGTAAYDSVTTQMALFATPSEVTTESDSTWGSGAANRQKLTASISPDYDGYVEVRVFFAKNFGASPDTLYADPLPVIT